MYGSRTQSDTDRPVSFSSKGNLKFRKKAAAKTITEWHKSRSIPSERAASGHTLGTKFTC